jgi:2-oxoisovalerate dehydrogenase E1 component
VSLSKRIDHQPLLPKDSVVICNFGDASSNHSTAQGAINAAAWAAYQSMPMPIVFICEDNGIGISTATPQGWIAANYQHRAGLTYLYCDGLNILDTYKTAKHAEHIARTLQKPVFLHVRTVRLLGHAGSDAEFVYRDLAKIEANEKQDPLLHTARILIENNLLTATQITDIYSQLEQRIAHIAEQAATRPRLSKASDVKASIIPDPSLIKAARFSPVDEAQREKLFVHEKHNLAKKQHSAKLINWTLLDLMAEQQNIVMCGEDIGKKGGVYNVTTKLCERFGKNRVINTLLDEQSILGLAIGLAHNGFCPIPEIQFLAYVHNAEDQIRGEAATLSYFSKGQFTNGMVIRIAGLAYQKGFGGHFHNDNSFAVFRDLPGVIIACPSNGADAVEMLRTCVKLAQEQKRVVIFLEPIALYMTRDLHEKGDELWAFDYVPPAKATFAQLGQVSCFDEGKDVCIISYGNGYYLARQAHEKLKAENIHAKIVDLKWLAPLDSTEITLAIAGYDKVLIVDECRQTASISEAIVTMITEHCQDESRPVPLLSRITAEDCFIPLGSAATSVLPSCDEIVSVTKALVSNTFIPSLYQRD